ncbi:MAG: squalene/phytoene synthase family protein, partial [Simplicispira sp.]|nr:squalene/phytoene synthase family protein [Simplicispira sp.]
MGTSKSYRFFNHSLRYRVLPDAQRCKCTLLALTSKAGPHAAQAMGQSRPMNPEQYVQQKAAASGSSFYYAFLFLPRPRREAITAFYAFCR